MMENPEISGLLQKKRGGFAKFMASNQSSWQYRFFTISKDGVLSYYDTDKPDSTVFENKSRGRLDLKNVNYELIIDQQIDGAPTPYCIQINPSTDEKWKLCADTKEDHGRWCKVLDRYLHEKASRISVGSPVSYASDDESDIRIPLEKKQSKLLSNSKDSDHGKSMHFNTIQASPTAAGEKEKKLSNTDLVGTGSTNASQQSVTTSTTINNNSSNTSHSSATKPAPVVSTTTTTPKVVPTVPIAGTSSKGKKRGGLKTTAKADLISKEWLEWSLVILIVNLCIYGIITCTSWFTSLLYLLVINVVIGHTLHLRYNRFIKATTALATAQQAALTASVAVPNSTSDISSEIHSVATVTTSHGSSSVTSNNLNSNNIGHSHSQESTNSSNNNNNNKVQTNESGKPTPGFTFQEVFTEPKLSPNHTWCKADPRQFNVRIGPDYNRYKKKAPSGPAIYEPFAVDVFCAKKRVDHAATRFQLPDTSHINTHHPYVPPIFIIQIQIPSEPPSSLFSTSEDGPGWAIVMYYRITEDSINQLKDFANASPAIKLFAEWCEKSTVDPAWRGRFKVICSCTNLEELGMPSAITSYNAKPVLIRRTGSIVRGSNYMEMDIHVHKFANLAKQSIYLISSRCGLMYMQIGFVIEGREDKELPETLFACVAVNRPQEDEAEFIFDD